MRAIFLDTKEIEDLTGQTQPAAQERFILDMGLKCHRNNVNAVVLLYEALVRHQMGEKAGSIRREPQLKLGVM